MKDLKPVIGPKLRRTSKHAYFAQWFSARIDSKYPLVKQDSEVEAIKWFSKEELFDAFDKTPEIFLTSLKDSALYFFEHANQN